MKFHEILRLDEPCRVAIVGAGGKTSTLWRIAESLTGRVIITTSTHLSADQLDGAEKKIYCLADEDLGSVDWGGLPRITSITGLIGEHKRVNGLSTQQMDALILASQKYCFSVVIEADGARGLALKAPSEHEPVIPTGMDAVVVVAGLSALGMPLDDRTVFRVEEYCRLAGMQPGEEINTEVFTSVLCHPQGGLKGIAEGTRRILLLNQADSLQDRQLALRVANNCGNSFDTIIIGSIGTLAEPPQVVARVERTACIILAAGGSSRFGGTPKGSIMLGGSALLTRAMQTAMEAGFTEQDIFIISGYQSQDLQPVIKPGWQVVNNIGWQSGQSSSIRAGLKAVMNAPGRQYQAVIFMLVDQPFVSPILLQKLLDVHQTVMTPIVAPMVNDVRANPVLFDRVTFRELMDLEGDTGGRAIMGHFPHTWVLWLNDNLLLDVDTPEDLERCKNVLGE